MKQHDFFQIIFGSDFPGFITIWDKQTQKTKFYDQDELDPMIGYIKKTAKTKDVYFGCGLQGKKLTKGRGKYQDINAIPGLWMDLDIQSDVHKLNHYPATKEETFKILKKFPLAPSIMISSGYGMHVIWLFDKPWLLLDEGVRKQASVLSGKFQDTIIAIFKEHGYTIDKTADLTRVLRIPGTLNHKKEPSVPVQRLKTKDAQIRRYTIKEIMNALESYKPAKVRTLKPIKKRAASVNYPGSSVQRILDDCSWFSHCQTDSATLSEPEWFYMLTIVSFCEDPLTWAHELSNNYEGYTEEETLEKVNRIRNTWIKPVSCDYIARNFSNDYCEKCLHKVKSPFQLGIDKSTNTLKKIGFDFDKEDHVTYLNGNMFAAYIQHRYKLLYTESGHFFEYHNGVWNYLSTNQLSRQLRNLLHEFVPNFWAESHEKRYLEALKREVPCVKNLNMERNFLNLTNGMFNLTEYKLSPHDPKYYSSIQIPLTFDLAAVCPNFDNFVSEIFEGDEERINVIDEVMGYCLTAETSAQKAFFLYGQGANGKSLLADIILHLCGHQNVSAIPLDDLSNSFNRYELVGKLLNMTTENEISSAGLDTSTFKAIVSGDQIQVEKKYAQSFMYQPYCKLIFSLNNLPYTRDKSFGFLRKVVIIPFYRTFRQNDLSTKNYDVLKQEILPELPGILNRALKGLQRLRKNNYSFSSSQAINELMLEYEHLINPYSHFVAEVIEQGDVDDKVTNERMHRTFHKWCIANGHDKIGNSSNIKRLIEIRKAMTDAQIKFDYGKGCKSGGIRHISGIRLKIKNARHISNIDNMEDFDA